MHAGLDHTNTHFNFILVFHQKLQSRGLHMKKLLCLPLHIRTGEKADMKMKRISALPTDLSAVSGKDLIPEEISGVPKGTTKAFPKGMDPVVLFDNSK